MDDNDLIPDGMLSLDELPKPKNAGEGTIQDGDPFHGVMKNRQTYLNFAKKLMPELNLCIQSNIDMLMRAAKNEFGEKLNSSNAQTAVLTMIQLATTLHLSTVGTILNCMTVGNISAEMINAYTAEALQRGMSSTYAAVPLGREEVN